jgi:hypothetical protein
MICGMEGQMDDRVKVRILGSEIDVDVSQVSRLVWTASGAFMEMTPVGYLDP